MNKILEAPKLLSCTVKDGVRHAVFNIEDLRRFVQNTDEAAVLVEDEKGNESLILIQPTRGFLAHHDRCRL
jgi:hypothetical protein